MAQSVATTFERHDDRTINELRPITLESGHLESVDGSCNFSIGTTCVDVSIIGPISSLKHSNNKKITESHLDVTVISEQGTTTSHEMYFKQQILSIFKCSILLNKYPLTTIYIHVQIICDNGCLLMAILNAVSIALLDSGIDCKTFPVSTSLGIINNENNKILLFDPTEKEMDLIQSFGTLSFSTSLSKITQNENVKSGNLLIGDFKKRKRKSRIKNNDSSNDKINEIINNEHEFYNDMDLIYCDIKGRVKMETLKELLKQCKVACYTIQFFIKRHFVESFKSLPTIYVQDDNDQ